MNRWIIFAAVLALTAGFSGTVLTQEAETVRPCKEDVDKFCKGIRPGHGRMLSCLKSHESEVSAACRDHIAEMREKVKGFMKDCRDDHRKFCKGIRPGHGRIAACLKSHEGELAEACRVHFSK